MTLTYILLASGVLSKAALFVAWKKLSAEKRRDLTDRLKRFIGLFDSNGLRYSKKHLAAIADKIPFWDISKQAQYLDVIC